MGPVVRASGLEAVKVALAGGGHPQWSVALTEARVILFLVVHSNHCFPFWNGGNRTPRDD